MRVKTDDPHKLAEILDGLPFCTADIAVADYNGVTCPIVVFDGEDVLREILADYGWEIVE